MYPLLADKGHGIRNADVKVRAPFAEEGIVIDWAFNSTFARPQSGPRHTARLVDRSAGNIATQSRVVR